MFLAAHVCLQSRNQSALVERAGTRRVVLDEFVECLGRCKFVRLAKQFVIAGRFGEVKSRDNLPQQGALAVGRMHRADKWTLRSSLLLVSMARVWSTVHQSILPRRLLLAICDTSILTSEEL